MSQNCPDAVDDLDPACADKDWFEDYIYDVLDDIVDAANIHINAEDGDPLDKIVRPWDLNPIHEAADLTEINRIETFLDNVLASGRVPKYMYEEGNAPNRFPDPVNADDVQVWEDCEGYWGSVQDVRDCMDLDPDELLSDSTCLDLPHANTFHKILKCLAEGKCYPDCQCPECSEEEECRCYTEVTYNTSTETWTPSSLSNLDWECREKTGDFADEPLNAWISDGETSGVCTWHRWSSLCE
jgi:hypothetical protein